MLFTRNIIAICLFLLTTSLLAQQKNMALLSGGNYIPLYGTVDKKPIEIESFYLDVYPVTNQEFLDFLKKNPRFLRSEIKTIFAVESYLSHWENDTNYGNLNPRAPVTNISWFVAKAYCECQDKRLPEMDEWEFAAMADETEKDARTKEEYTKFILSWYEKPNTWKNSIGKTIRNYWGVYDLNGLVWEWTADFNSLFLSGESRKNTESDSSLFCGSSSLNATNLMNYAAFMRYAIRSSLKANYTTKNMGFRCAKTFTSTTSK